MEEGICTIEALWLLHKHFLHSSTDHGRGKTMLPSYFANADEKNSP